MLRNGNIEDSGAYMDDMSGYLDLLSGGDARVNPLRSAPARKAFAQILDVIRTDKLREFLMGLAKLLEREIARQEESRRPFAAGTRVTPNKLIDKQLTRLLVFMSRTAEQGGDFLRHTAGVLVVYFALYKLMQSPTIVRLIADFLPKKRNARGNRVRDRREQIRSLILRDDAYRRQYLQLVRTLYPVYNRQITTIVKTFDLQNLMLRNEKAQVNREAYVKLLNSFLHDTVHSGLSVIVGFSHRPASVAFEQGADRLLAKMEPAG